MTIGIGMSGPRAGRGVMRALAAVERVGRGAIGGFVSMAVITADGRVIRAEAQRGGSLALPPDIVASMEDAPLAGLISSGPDRPEPLSRFIAVDPRFGLVTGHRFPFVPGRSGMPLNRCALDRLAAGDHAAEAVARVVDAHPDSDVGLVAVDMRGRVAARNTRFVARRQDGGAARRQSRDGTAWVAVLHNSIFPVAPLAELAAWTALDVIDPVDRADRTLLVRRGTRLVGACRDAVCASGSGTVLQINTRQHCLLASGVIEGSPILMGMPVICDEVRIGTIMTEPYCVVRDGQIQSLDGRDQATLRLRSS